MDHGLQEITASSAIKTQVAATFVLNEERPDEIIAWLQAHENDLLSLTPSMLQVASARFGVPAISPSDKEDVDAWHRALRDMARTARAQRTGVISSSTSLTFGGAHDVLDVALGPSAVYALAVTQPSEWAMEAEANVVLHHRFTEKRDEPGRMTTLRGIGLPDQHGLGAWLARPRRVISCSTEGHFLLVADRAPPAWQPPATAGRNDDDSCLACDDAGTPLASSTAANHTTAQMVVYSVDGVGIANALHYLPSPGALTSELCEGDLAVTSVQVFGDRVVGLVRWRDPEELQHVHRGRQGELHFLDGGWRAVEAVVWDWRRGTVLARIKIEGVYIEPPQLILRHDSKLVVIIDNEEFQETAVYDVEQGGKRLFTRLRRLSGQNDDEGVDLDARITSMQISSQLLSIERLDLPMIDDSYPLCGIYGSRFVAPAKDGLFVTEQVVNDDHKEAKSICKLPVLDELRLAEGACLDDRMRCSMLHRAIYAVAPARSPLHTLRPTTVIGKTRAVSHFIVDFRPDLACPIEGQQLFRARCSRHVAGDEEQGRRPTRDSGIVEERAGDKAGGRQRGWTTVGVAEVLDEQLKAVLAKKRVWTDGRRVVAVDEDADLGRGSLVVLQF